MVCTYNLLSADPLSNAGPPGVDQPHDTASLGSRLGANMAFILCIAIIISTLMDENKNYNQNIDRIKTGHFASLASGPIGNPCGSYWANL